MKQLAQIGFRTQFNNVIPRGALRLRNPLVARHQKQMLRLPLSMTRLGLLTACLVLVGLGVAQTSVGFTVPTDSTLEISDSEVTFDLSQEIYPPAEFPAYYLPTTPTEPMTLRVFTNTEGSWRIGVGFDGLLNEAANLMLSPSTLQSTVFQCSSPLEYSIDGGGSWLPLCQQTNIITGIGATEGHQEYLFELRLRLDGSEVPGSYVGQLTFSLSEN